MTPHITEALKQLWDFSLYEVGLKSGREQELLMIRNRSVLPDKKYRRA